jgi:dTDP-4-dehydrorhamnose reductase
MNGILEGDGTRPLLVLGANGLVGSRLVARLLAPGVGAPQGEGPQAPRRLLAVGRGPARGAAASLSGGGSGGRLEYLDLDLLRDDALRDLIAARAPSSVFHAAGLTDVDACERDPALAWALNVRSFEAAALGCREVGARLVAFSTDYVFDGEAGPYGEEDLPNPRGAYARTKRAGEEAALLLSPGSVVCRVAAVFSGAPGSRRTFADATVEALRAGKPVKAFHDQLVSPTLADDAAASSLVVWASGLAGVFHCSGGEVVDRVAFCRTLARLVGASEALVQPVALADLKLLAPRPLRAGLRVEKVRALGARPLTLEEALRRYLSERGEGG